MLKHNDVNMIFTLLFNKTLFNHFYLSIKLNFLILFKHLNHINYKII